MNQPTARDFFIASLMDNMRIDIDNPLTAGAIDRATGFIPENEFTNFIAFIAARTNDYQKPIEIIGKGAKEFADLRSEQLKNTGLESEMKRLVDKCRRIANYAYDSKPKGLNFTDFAHRATFANFPNAFSSDEMELLNKVGGCKRWLIDYDEHNFLVELITLKVKATLNYNTTPALKYQPNKTIETLKLGSRRSS